MEFSLLALYILGQGSKRIWPGSKGEMCVGTEIEVLDPHPGVTLPKRRR